jgi:ABC-2 type transporter
VVRRDLKYQPGELIGALTFPALMVLLFGYVFGSAIAVPDGNYREYLMPGLFAMSAFAGVIATTVIVAGDAAKGVMDRFRSMPMARLAVPFGQTGADILTGMGALLIMVGCGLDVGTWPLSHPVLATLLWTALLFAVFVPLSVRRLATANRRSAAAARPRTRPRARAGRAGKRSGRPSPASLRLQRRLRSARRSCVWARAAGALRAGWG